MEQHLQQLWQPSRQRLLDRHLLGGTAPALSLRIPGSSAMWFGAAQDATPHRIVWRDLPADEAGAGLHASVYETRDDVCAVASGGGAFGLALADFGGTLPGVFDEQVRHLGLMPPPQATAGLPRALERGGNVLIVQGTPLVLGTTGARLALNAELFEKCAQACVLALASGGKLQPLPWIVRHVANGRLMKDERQAAQRVRQGLLPEESQGY